LKPWSKCENNFERLDPLNGIPLTPVADYLLDKGYLTFDSKGYALFSNTLKTSELKSMGIDPSKIYKIKILDHRQEQYLEYHRHNIFVE
jgi:putative restriction endonuclease